MLRAADVTFSYHALGTPVLRGVSLDVPADGFVGILGPNGSGKTTLLRVLAGTLQPSSGRVSLDDLDLSRVSRTTMARRMAVVPQDTHLVFDFTALEVVLMGRYPHLATFEVEGPRDIAIAREALAATGTRDARGPAVRHAQRRRETARHHRRRAGTDFGRRRPCRRESWRPTPIHDSRPDTGILLLDEPTAALDLAYQLEVATLLRDLQRRRPIAIVISTHDLNFAAGLCRTLVLLKDGGVLAAGPTEEVLTAQNIRALYGVEAEVQSHAGAGHLVVVPMRRVKPGSAP